MLVTLTHEAISGLSALQLADTFVAAGPREETHELATADELFDSGARAFLEVQKSYADP